MNQNEMNIYASCIRPRPRLVRPVGIADYMGTRFEENDMQADLTAKCCTAPYTTPDAEQQLTLV